MRTNEILKPALILSAFVLASSACLGQDAGAKQAVDDEYFDTAESHHQQGFWMIYGIFLPDEVLEKVYYSNAARLLGLPKLP